MTRDDAGAAADEERGLVGVPHEPSADRTADLELVTDGDVVVQEHRDLTALEPLDRQLEFGGVIGRGRDRIRARRGVAVRRGQTHHTMLTRAMRHGLGQREAERLGARRLGFDRDDLRHVPRRRTRRGAASWARPSVALVSLFEPGITEIVIAVLFPEPVLVVVEEAQARR